jgi:hypothetical protein
VTELEGIDSRVARASRTADAAGRQQLANEASVSDDQDSLRGTSLVAQEQLQEGRGSLSHVLPRFSASRGSERASVSVFKSQHVCERAAFQVAATALTQERLIANSRRDSSQRQRLTTASEVGAIDSVEAFLCRRSSNEKRTGSSVWSVLVARSERGAGGSIDK